MKKTLILGLFFLTGMFSVAHAEKLPVKLTSAQTISTIHDEAQIGDWIEFRVVNDVYQGNKLVIKKGTPVIAVIDFVHENGYVQDNAEIQLKKFILKDVNSQKVEFEYPFIISQKLVVKNNVKKSTKRVVLALVRGSEIYIEPDSIIFTVFITQ